MQYMPFNFKTFTRNDKPNSYMICPDNYCHTRIDAVSPEFNVNVSALESAWEKMVVEQPRTTLIHHDKADDQYQYVQRSFFFRFPDYINVRFIPIDQHKSTLAIYSHSVYGHSDFGVNEKRVKAWLANLDHILAQ